MAMYMQPIVSILLPTRGRSKALHDSIASLNDKARKPENIEILLRRDYDDPTILGKLPTNVKIYTGERHGYKNLHKYYNELCAEATGRWLWIWNDDFLIMTQDYDDILSQKYKFKLLTVKMNHDHRLVIGPLVPLKWYNILGHLSLNVHIDTWVGEIGRKIGIEDRVPISILHDRADITGNNRDQTFAERQYDTRNFHRMKSIRINEAEKIVSSMAIKLL
jgi:hypothetical protein